MKTKTVAVLFAVLIFAISSASPVFSGHKDEKGAVKGIITKIEISELEITVKDEKGMEKKVRTKDTSFKAGDRVVIKDGKLMPEVKPITGGY